MLPTIHGSLIKCGLFVSVAFSCFAADPSTQPAGAHDLRILYTGKLLGYARMPDVQRIKHREWLTEAGVNPECKVGQDCTAIFETVNITGAPSSLAGTLKDLIDTERRAAGKTAVLLLGVGDNLAVDFLSRTVVAERYDGSQIYVPKDELKYLTNSASGWFHRRDIAEAPASRRSALTNAPGPIIDFDNTANFFKQSGYTALVPGKHDLFYGPERLRALARFLAQPIAGRPDFPQPVLLGTNLVINTTDLDQAPAKAEFLRENVRTFRTVSSQKPDFQWDLALSPLPWMRSFRLKGAYDNNDVRFFVEHSVELCRLAGKHREEETVADCQKLKVSGRENKIDALFKLPDEKPLLEANRTWRICADTIDAIGKEKICQVFDVKDPLLMQDTIPPYVRLDKHNVIIMGVVTKSLGEQVGSMGTHWKNDTAGRKLDTYVETTDPIDSLTQLLEYCEAKKDCNGETTLVLLAHMPRDSAAILNRRMKHRFNLVIAQADTRFSTHESAVVYPKNHRPIVLVPEAPYQSEDNVHRLATVLQTATLFRDPRSSHYVQTGAVRGKDAEFLDHKEDARWVQDLTQRYVSLFKPPADEKPDLKARFQDLVLEAMRRHKQADVALIQDRDFHFLDLLLTRVVASPIPDRTQVHRATLEQILWKGDFVVTRTLTGSALKLALEVSRQLQEKETDTYVVQVESGRTLRYLGLYQDATTKTWYVNGVPLNDKDAYSVAMPDFLAFGDTGYPSLRDESIDDSEQAHVLGELPKLAELAGGILEPAKTLPLDLQSYLDPISKSPLLPPPTASLWDRIRQIYHDALSGVPPHSSTPVRHSQERTYWRVFIDKGEISYSAFWNNQPNEEVLKARFAGVTESGVVAFPKYSIGTTWHAEVRRDASRTHIFTRMEEEYTRDRIRSNPNGTFIRSFPFNQVSLETGARVAFASTRSRPWHGLLLSVNGTTQLRRAPQSFAFPHDTCEKARNQLTGELNPCPAIANRSDIARTSRLLGKIGFRGEGQESWYEIGYFNGKSWRPVEFTLLRNDETIAICGLSDLVGAARELISIDRCLGTRAAYASPVLTPFDGNALTIRSRVTDRWDSGLFANFNMQFKLPKAWKFERFSIDNRFRFFRDGPADAPTDARFIQRLTAGPTITIANSLSLKPSYSLFFFENKAVNNQLLTHSFDWKIEYRFDWKTGMPLSHALGYGRPK